MFLRASLVLGFQQLQIELWAKLQSGHRKSHDRFFVEDEGGVYCVKRLWLKGQGDVRVEPLHNLVLCSSFNICMPDARFGLVIALTRQI